MNNEIKEIETDIKDFLRNLLKNLHIDFIIPIQRKGVDLLLLLSEEIPTLWNYVIFEDKLDYYNPSYFQNKDVLIFDDSLYRGKRLIELKQRLTTEFSARVITAVLLIHKQCPAQPRPKPGHYMPKFWDLDDLEYGNMKVKIQKLLFQACRPTDIDHIIFCLETRDFPLASFLDILREADIGSVVPTTGSNFTEEGIAHVTIDGLSIVDSLSIHNGIRLEGVQKVRFYINRTMHKVYCVPLVFPAVIMNYSWLSCQYRCEWICFSELYGSSLPEKIEKSRVCFDCAVFNLSLNLGILFFDRMRDCLVKFLKFKTLDFNRIEIASFYPVIGRKVVEETSRIINRLKSRIEA